MDGHFIFGRINPFRYSDILQKGKYLFPKKPRNVQNIVSSDLINEGFVLILVISVITAVCYRRNTKKGVKQNLTSETIDAANTPD